MKFFFIFLLALICLFPCKNKQQELRGNILPILENIALEDSLVVKVDSIKIYKIDTLTDLQYALTKIRNLYFEIRMYNVMSDEYKKQSIYELKESKNRVHDPYLKASTALDSVKLLNNMVANYGDSINRVNSQIKAINQKIKNRQVDSKSFKGYVVLFKLLGSDKRNIEVKKDSLTTFLSPNLRIIPIGKI